MFNEIINKLEWLILYESILLGGKVFNIVVEGNFKKWILS